MYDLAAFLPSKEEGIWSEIQPEVMDKNLISNPRDELWNLILEREIIICPSSEYSKTRI